ncbi:MAG: RnfABCDGE type electron transport complex subunit D [Deltaproteobacteria bacterium]|nr:RnfABCDGE type electron transport complex subunit D [Deltaproteobacteria bacterium]
MTGLIKKMLETASGRLEKSRLKPLKPLLNAVDGFFFRGDDVTVGAPHIRDGNNLKRMFIFVVFAALPSAVAGIYYFGWRAVLIIAISYMVGLTVEITFAVIRKEEISEGAFVTCILYPLILPPDLPLWMVALGIFMGVFFGKEVFGGTGYNVFNPALVSRVFLYICFPVAMTANWTSPMSGWGGLMTYQGDAISGATPLALYKMKGELTPLWDLFWGNVSGSLGETSAFLVLIGGMFLLITRVADWRIPLSFLGSALIFSLIFHAVNPTLFAPAGFQLLSGGMLFGAFFMATDPVTSPFTKEGRWFFGAACGLITILIRGYSGYAEGVMFAILFMNIFSSLIDRIVLGYRYREVRV